MPVHCFLTIDCCLNDGIKFPEWYCFSAHFCNSRSWNTCRTLCYLFFHAFGISQVRQRYCETRKVLDIFSIKQQKLSLLDRFPDRGRPRRQSATSYYANLMSVYFSNRFKFSTRLVGFSAFFIVCSKFIIAFKRRSIFK